MKATDDKGTRSTQDKKPTATAKPNSPQKPERKENPGKTPLKPPFGDPQKNTPEKWPGGIPTDPGHETDPDYNETGEVDEGTQEEGMEEHEER